MLKALIDLPKGKLSIFTSYLYALYYILSIWVANLPLRILV